MKKTNRRLMADEELRSELLNFQHDIRELHDDLRKLSSGVHLAPALQPQVQACYRALGLAHEHMGAAVTLHASQQQQGGQEGPDGR